MSDIKENSSCCNDTVNSPSSSEECWATETGSDSIEK